jgi:hypothetical protein
MKMQVQVQTPQDPRKRNEKKKKRIKARQKKKNAKQDTHELLGRFAPAQSRIVLLSEFLQRLAQRMTLSQQFFSIVLSGRMKFIKTL